MVEETYFKQVLTFMGRNQRVARWDRIAGRGAHLVENVTQALTRDILKIGLMRLDAEGFNIIGHAHDEIIVESREGDNARTWERCGRL
jgi:DNA polymerase